MASVNDDSSHRGDVNVVADDLLHLNLLGTAIARATDDDRWTSLEAKLISGGKSNLTFEVSSDAGSLIVRRPPTGDILPSAHDMVREARVQKALQGTSVPVANIIMVDGSSELMGVPFYVMEKIEGHVVRGAMPEAYAVSSAEKIEIANALIDVLIELHGVDAESIGLDDFGRPAGFLERQVRRWKQQWELTTTFEAREVDELASRLGDLVPATLRSSIVHGDYRLDNCVMSMDGRPSVRAVLDWELSSLGDSISDFALALFYWREAGDIPLSLIPAVSSESGFPPRNYLVERYSTKTDVDMDGMNFYNAFARFKYAVIAQGVLARSLDGAMAGQDFGDLRSEVEAVAHEGLCLIRKKG